MQAYFEVMGLDVDDVSWDSKMKEEMWGDSMKGLDVGEADSKSCGMYIYIYIYLYTNYMI